MSDSKPRVLIVDDEVGYAEDIAALVSDELQCDVAGDPDSARSCIQRTAYDLVLQDIDLHHETDGIAFLKELKELDPSLPVVMLTKTSDLSAIVESIKSGAFYYVVKGEDLSVHDIVHVARLAIEDARMKRAVYWVEEEERGALGKIVGSSPATARLRDEIARVAGKECCVLITGESGTGKELVARALHAESGRAATGRFVAVNCAAFPEQLLESELFGHEKGAFTGADKRRKGKFEYASGGTLLLDEIGEMSPKGQAKLLRVLQDDQKRFERVGGNQTVVADVRVVASTNRDLTKLIEDGTFRQDLYFRFAEYVIHVSPLRDRPEDIVDIAKHFAGTLGLQVAGREMGISQAALDALSAREWRRNNVRELRNVMKSGIIRCDGDTLQPEHLAYDAYEFGASPPTYAEAKSKAVRQFKHRYLSWLLRLTNGNVAAAADIAGIQRPVLHRHLTDIGLDPNSFRK